MIFITNAFAGNFECLGNNSCSFSTDNGIIESGIFNEGTFIFNGNNNLFSDEREDSGSGLANSGNLTISGDDNFIFGAFHSNIGQLSVSGSNNIIYGMMFMNIGKTEITNNSQIIISEVGTDFSMGIAPIVVFDNSEFIIDGGHVYGIDAINVTKEYYKQLIQASSKDILDLVYKFYQLGGIKLDELNNLLGRDELDTNPLSRDQLDTLDALDALGIDILDTLDTLDISDAFGFKTEYALTIPILSKKTEFSDNLMKQIINNTNNRLGIILLNYTNWDPDDTSNVFSSSITIDHGGTLFLGGVKNMYNKSEEGVPKNLLRYVYADGTIYDGHPSLLSITVSNGSSLYLSPSTELGSDLGKRVIYPTSTPDDYLINTITLNNNSTLHLNGLSTIKGKVLADSTSTIVLSIEFDKDGSTNGGTNGSTNSGTNGGTNGTTTTVITKP
jgi:hypothetical protein